MIVYRIEHDVSGFGPYKHYYCHHKDVVLTKKYPQLFSEKYCPSPDEFDLYDEFDKTYYFGFKSLNDLITWFGHGSFFKEHDAEFSVVVYDTKHMLKASKQIAFKKNESHLIQKLSFKEAGIL